MHIPAGLAQVNHFFTGSAFPRGAQITYGVGVTGAATPTQVATELATIFEARWKSAMGITMTHSKVRVKFGPNEDGPFIDYSGSFVGTYNSAPDSPQVAVLCRKNTAFGGRHGTGRMFLPFAIELDTVAGGTVDPTDLAGLQARADQWIADLVAATYVDYMALLHADEDTAPMQVASLSVQSLLSTQRRRIRKVGGRRTSP